MDSGATANEEVASDGYEQTTHIGIIVGGSIGGAVLVSGVVAIMLCRKATSRSRVRHSIISPKGMCKYCLISWHVCVAVRNPWNVHRPLV